MEQTFKLESEVDDEKKKKEYGHTKTFARARQNSAACSVVTNRLVTVSRFPGEADR